MRQVGGLWGDGHIYIKHSFPKRLVLEEESPVLYHNLLNSRVYHEKDKQGIIINQEVRVREGVV